MLNAQCVEFIYSILCFFFGRMHRFGYPQTAYFSWIARCFAKHIFALYLLACALRSIVEQQLNIYKLVTMLIIKAIISLDFKTALMPLHCTSQRQYRNIVQNKQRTKTTHNFENIFIHLNKMFSVVPLQTKANFGFFFIDFL